MYQAGVEDVGNVKDVYRRCYLSQPNSRNLKA